MFQMRAKMISVGLLGAAVMLPIDLAKADQLGHASWYSLPANKTANGERMNPNELTAAHRSLPFGTRVVVENLANGRSVVVRINDRGPFVGGRIIDLSKAAASSIGMLHAGTAKVRVTTAGGGSALAALGETTVKAKAGASVAAAARVDMPADSSAEIKIVAQKSSKPKSVAAKASSGRKHADRKLKARAKADLATAGKRFTSRRFAARNRFRASNGVRAMAEQTTGLPGRRTRVVSTPHPYAILGATPGFMKPTPSRRAG